MKKTDKQITNCLISDLSNLIMEFEQNSLTKETLLQYFADLMDDANVDSDITVKVLEQPFFGEEGKNVALGIKINEGW